MSLNVPGLVVMVVFYLMVLGTGVWAAFKSKKEQKSSQANRTEVTLLGNRGISLAVGVFTMTATFVGGGFIVGLTEAVYTPTMGLMWAVMPVTAAMSFIIGGLFFAKTMREKKYVTMMDPFQIKYGNLISGFLSVAILISDVFWVTGTLIGLGSTISVVLDLSYTICIWISAAVAIIYTLMGGLYSVAYTDIIQLTLIFFSLWLCVPFVLMNPYSVDITETALNFTYQAPWIGYVDGERAWRWIDNFLILVRATFTKFILLVFLLMQSLLSTGRTVTDCTSVNKSDEVNLGAVVRVGLLSQLGRCVCQVGYLDFERDLL